MRISVFGGSQASRGTQAYLDAQELGRSLAQMGCSVLTGGYAGTMEAVSRGAAEAGGHVIGVTCSEVEQSHNTVVNPWVAEEWKKPSLMERLQALIEGCDAALALPGGPGTLAEITLTWNLMIVDALSPRPLILIGHGWHAVLNEFFLQLEDYIPSRQRELLKFATDTTSAVIMVKGML